MMCHHTKYRHPPRFNNPIRRRLLGLLEQHVIPELAEIISDYEGYASWNPFTAARDGDVLAMELCFRSGADVLGKNKGAMLIDAACGNGHLRMLKWLVKEAGANVNHVDPWGRSPLHIVCDNNYLKMAKWLINKAGADVNGVTVKKTECATAGRTPLYSACSIGNLAMVEWLVKEAGAEVNWRDQSGESPLHLTCVKHHLAVVKWLVEEAGANVNQVNDCGWSPLMMACYYGQLSVVQWLVCVANADVNVKSTALWYDAHRPGSSALDVAEHPEIVTFLMDQQHKRRRAH